MEFTDLLISLLGVHAVKIPIYMAYFIAIALAIANHQTLGQKANSLIIIFVLMFFLDVVSSSSSIFLTTLHFHTDLTVQQVGVYSGVIAFVFSCLYAGVWGWIIYTLFSHQKDQRQR